MNAQLIFLAPNVLFGLFAILIPVIIHLFNLRRTKRQYFPNVSFLKKVKEESSAKRKPVELLILVCRILAVSLLVLAFARPTLKDGDDDLALQERVILYLDNSLSLSGTDSEYDFNRLVREASDVILAYPDGTSFHLLENGYGNSLGLEYSKESVSEQLTELEQIEADRTLSEVGTRISAAGLRGDIYLFSDFQNKFDFEAIRMDTSNNYYIVPIIPEEVSNVYIDTAYLENTFLSGSFSNLLKLKVRRNYRDEQVVNLKLNIDGQLFGTAEIDFGNQLIQDHEFQIPQGTAGLERVLVEIDDSGLLFDNSFYLSINALDKIKVIEIFDSSSPSFIQALYSENEMFDFVRMDSRFLDNEVLSSANLIVVNQLTEFSNQLVNALENRLNEGGSVIVVPDRNTRSSDLSRLGIQVVSDIAERVELNQPDFENPIFDGVFEEPDERIEMPEASVSWRLLNSELDYLTFKNGRSFLAKVSRTGNLFFYTSPFNESYTSYTNHALFVPVMYKLALGSQASLSKVYYYSDQETIFYPNQDELIGKVVTFEGQDGAITPDQRMLGGQIIFEIPKGVVRSGHYSITVEGESYGTIAFNVPKSESNISPIDRQVLTELNGYDQITVIDLNEENSASRFLEAGVVGKSLWAQLLIAALFFLFAEIILIRYL
ncbi:BatA domain-containing protein [Roseivirga sp. UBA1976]|uniref:BatA domain-containing protein n=1 Tax=Roseivirga sp. UBA1976 TaxID=1947386 RepID=UPI00257FAA7B|nr:BatA domain-containing protein [Roseivirga sp. UBA1976]|tara:strand:- start:11440 stop:13422 length:1983 start_codon:yes stop_codon:yes gene_type:complete